MSHDVKFSQDITNFQRYGTYTYEYDEVGNVVFNSASNDFSQVYLGLPLPNFVYDNTKIVSFYDPAFTEFIPPTVTSSAVDVDQLQGDLEASQQANAALTQQLNSLIAINETTPSNSAAAKQVILELRRALNQGRVESDFSPDFPYTPLKKEASIAEETAVQSASTAPPETTSTPEVMGTPEVVPAIAEMPVETPAAVVPVETPAALPTTQSRGSDLGSALRRIADRRKSGSLAFGFQTRR